MSLGERLLELRKSKHLSQEELAFKLDVTRQTVSKWETDQSTPDFDKIMPLCELYGITSDELLTGIKNKEEQSENPKEVNKKKRLGLVISIFLFFLAVAWVVLADDGLNLPDGVYVPIFLLIVALGVCIIVYFYAGTVNNKKREKKEKKEEKASVTKSEKVFDAVKGLIAIVVLFIYLGISFLTGAWYITWIIWPMYAVVMRIVELCMLLKGDEGNND